jgi:hypothetical protein
MTEQLFTALSSVPSSSAAAVAPRRNSSERELADALQESEERYRLLLDGIQSYAIFMMDTKGQIRV